MISAYLSNHVHISLCYGLGPVQSVRLHLLALTQASLHTRCRLCSSYFLRPPTSHTAWPDRPLHHTRSETSQSAHVSSPFRLIYVGLSPDKIIQQFKIYTGKPFSSCCRCFNSFCPPLLPPRLIIN